jgi:hypothetical protein
MTSNASGRSDLTDTARKHAWLRVRAAMRTYSRDPTRSNAEEVESAWKLIRRIDTVSHWREPQLAASGQFLPRPHADGRSAYDRLRPTRAAAEGVN